MLGTKEGDDKKEQTIWEEYLNLIESSNDKTLSDDDQAILDVLQSDETIAAEIDKLIDDLDSGVIELGELESKFILLLQSVLFKLSHGKSKEFSSRLMKSEKEIIEQIAMLSRYVMMQKSFLAKELSKEVKSQDGYSHLTKQSIKFLKDIIKRFAIYEVYKVLNPRRIAGETRSQNFINDAIVYGVKAALKFDNAHGAKLSKAELYKLEQEHKKFTKQSRGSGALSI